MQYTTPQQTAEAGPAVATVERQKSQISKLQAEIETVSWFEDNRKNSQVQIMIMVSPSLPRTAFP